MLEHLKKYKIILGSKSPRRQELLKGIISEFEIKAKEIDESFPEEFKKQEIPVFLSQEKAKVFEEEIKKQKALLITCDTIVWVNGHALNKPADKSAAIEMLRELSGNMHEVFTGVTITTSEKSHSFFEETKVYFKPLTDAEINFYIDTCRPFDKAGAYGVQEWMGFAGIRRIEGCFFNVMGLPLSKLYDELENF